MNYSKSFPKKSDKSVYPIWEEVELTPEEELQAEKECQKANNDIMKSCLDDARQIVKENRLFESQNAITTIAVSLFDKRASHEVFFKERLAKKKFEEMKTKK